MDFSQLSFWLILLCALPLLAAGKALWPQSTAFRKAFILLLSLFLLGFTSLPTLGIFLAVSLTAYAACRAGARLSSALGRRVLLGGLIPLLLLPLLYYKYAYFLAHTICGAEWDSLRGLIIPVGISFYTFQIIGFCVDTLGKGRAVPPFADYMNFCAFFPQIVAGPIERRDDLLPQISAPKMALSAADLHVGLRYIVLGLFFKMALADNLALAFVQGYRGGNAWMVWMNNLLFTFRIYFDFGGYAMTAYGIARCLGITLRLNFLSPYTAPHIGEFWRRWHTSLMQWFRDYIYIPLGGGRTRLWAANVLLVFLVSGLWHGAGYNFLLWGALSGLAVVAHRLFAEVGLRLPAALGWALTFGFMVMVWMFFYDTDAALLQQHLATLANPAAYGIGEFVATLKALRVQGTLAIAFLPLSFLVIAAESLSLRRRGDAYALLLSTPACALMVFLTVVLEASADSLFIYFSF
ncbi:MAG: hypothetical protein MJ051_07790 [Akkermansia sp.]|nr:hypothetical protein [Akkermansia sp.]